MKSWQDCATQSEAQAVTLGFTVDEAMRLADLLAVLVLDGAEGEDFHLVTVTIEGLRGGSEQ